MPKIAIGLNAVIAAVTEEVPRILTVRRRAAGGGGGVAEPAREDALPFGPLDPESDRTLDRGLRRWVREQTGLELGYVEQLYTFADRDRDPRERQGGPRVVSIGYLALVREREGTVAGEARWLDFYEVFPWEDWRAGRPEVLDRAIAPALARWAAGPGAPARERRERADIAFGLGGAPWDGERVLERYELLYEAALVNEALRDALSCAMPAESATSGFPAESAAGPSPPGRRAASSTIAVGGPAPATSAARARSPAAAANPAAAAELGAGASTLPGRPMAFDHRRIVATALGRLRGKLKYRPVIFELLPAAFTLLQLQRVVEALAGVRLHKQNFRRLVENAGLVEGTGSRQPATGGRPAELFVFRREVLRERPAPGVGIPGMRRSG
ncbi:MAG TPA: hypothetical protein VHR45_24805 [Thermoanaerobaculia bacterium]|nr:hypothetical protein [Thermoanaerobaculia bacterium]